MWVGGGRREGERGVGGEGRGKKGGEGGGIALWVLWEVEGKEWEKIGGEA